MVESRKRAVVPQLAAVLRWNAEQARTVLAAARTSGLSRRAFAKREGLDPQRLARWQRELAQRQSEPVAFEEVGVAVHPGRREVTDSEARFEVVLRGGRAIRVGMSFDDAALLRLVRVLEGQTC